MSPDLSTVPRPEIGREDLAEKFPSQVKQIASPRVFGLDVLRAAAILSVVFAHYFVVLYPHTAWWFGLFGHGGFYGVELFFVLSGFLIGRILIRKGEQLNQLENLSTFYLRRWFRTLPLFWLFLGLNVLLEIFLRQHHLSASEILTQGFFLRNWAGFHFTFFSESWSLAVEEWFYLLFAAALFLGLRFWPRRFDVVFLSLATGFFLFSTIARMISAPQPEATWTQWQRMIVIYRFDALMFGVFGAWVSLRYPNVWRNRAGACAIVGVVFLGAMYATLWHISHQHLEFSADNYFARTFRFTLVSLGFALLLPFASNWKLARENLVSANIRRIALWSYALYLVHLPVFLVATHFHLTGRNMGWPAAVASFVFLIAVSILLSAVLYRFFESRCTHLREKAAPAIAAFFARD